MPRIAGLALALALVLGACNGTRVAGTGDPVQLREPDLGPVEPIIDPYGRTNANRTRVALLLPLSGRGSDIGQALLNSAQMAVFDAGDDNFELVPRDTGGTPQGAAEAASLALAEGAQLILGPFFGTSVAEVRTVAESAGVNVIAFTSDRTVAGRNVFVMGFVPAGDVEQIVRYSSTQGHFNYAALAPNNPYGQTVVAALEESAASVGATVQRVEFYDPNSADQSASVEAIAEPGLFGTVEYDAILIPETGLKLRALAAMLPFFDVTNVQILGTGIWDGAELGLEPDLVGSWYAAPQPELRTEFERRYFTLFGQNAPRLATLAYDAVALAAALSRMSDRPGFDIVTLTNPSGFAGLDGVFRFRQDGVVERAQAILEVTQDGSVVRVPAAQSFAAGT